MPAPQSAIPENYKGQSARTRPGRARLGCRRSVPIKVNRRPVLRLRLATGQGQEQLGLETGSQIPAGAPKWEAGDRMRARAKARMQAAAILQTREEDDAHAGHVAAP